MIPIKQSAHSQVGVAIKKGKLIRQPCGVCGIGRVVAHHTDYNKPLEVMWLCHKHHKQWHRENGFPVGRNRYIPVYVSKDFHKQLVKDSKKTKIPITHLIEKQYKKIK